MCSGNRRLSNDPNDEKMLEDYRALVKKPSSIFGHVTIARPVWKEDDVQSSAPRPVPGLVLQISGNGLNATATTAKDGSYEFTALPDGKYTVVPGIDSKLDFDHEYEDRYQADLSAGQCANINFELNPSTRIRGHVTLPAAVEPQSLKVVAVPVHTKKLNQFSGQSDFTDENGHFDLWPLPPGDYHVGVNINSSPKADSPFPPTYFPGVTSEKAAAIVHVEEGEIKELELRLPEVAKTRLVHFVAIGLDGKPLKAIYVQLEDLRHPGDASSNVNVDLDSTGAGTLKIYSGYSYHLHGSHWVSYGNDWCSKPVMVLAGTEPVEARFIMDQKSGNCDIYEIDGLKR
jgi:Carboxypeptidase regulatory-like domain